MAEIWCFCPTCERWFYPESGGDPTCPVCGTAASRAEEHTAG